MVRIMVPVLVAALAGTASAAGWRDLRVDASSEVNFDQSIELFRGKLTKSRKHAFERALQDIWTQRTQDATAEQREYTQEDYYSELDGLSYKQVVRVLDPTGEQAQRYRAEYFDAKLPPGPIAVVPHGNGVPLKPPGYNTF